MLGNKIEAIRWRCVGGGRAFFRTRPVPRVNLLCVLGLIVETAQMGTDGERERLNGRLSLMFGSRGSQGAR
jgi:hypothetical protein